MTKDKQSLISEIREAFKDVELDGGIGLSEADALDNYADEHICEECKKKDEKYFWNTITANELNQFRNGLCFFDAKGMRFHLPAFMIAEIKNQYRDSLIFTLTNLSDCSKSQFELLSQKQREVVKLFLEYLLNDPEYEFDRPDIKTAIENYWSK